MAEFDIKTASMVMLINEVRGAIEPIAKTKVHNPNKSTSMETVRTVNIKAREIERIKHLYQELTNHGYVD